MNFSCRLGEIDIVCKDGECLVFAEVKYRKSSEYGRAAEAVDYKKMKKICKVSDYYRLIHKIDENTEMRFDVIAVDNGNIEWIKNAFEYVI